MISVPKRKSWLSQFAILVQVQELGFNPCTITTFCGPPRGYSFVLQFVGITVSKFAVYAASAGGVPSDVGNGLEDGGGGAATVTAASALTASFAALSLQLKPENATVRVVVALAVALEKLIDWAIQLEPESAYDQAALSPEPSVGVSIASLFPFEKATCAFMAVARVCIFGTTRPVMTDAPGLVPKNASGVGIGTLGFGITIGSGFPDWSKTDICPPAYLMQLIKLASEVAGFTTAVG